MKIKNHHIKIQTISKLSKTSSPQKLFDYDCEYAVRIQSIVKPNSKTNVNMNFCIQRQIQRGGGPPGNKWNPFKTDALKKQQTLL